MSRSLSTYVTSTLLNLSNKQNIDNFDSVTSTNIITPFDINELISGITSCINYISALSYENNGQFAKFWQNPQNYVIRTIDDNFKYVRTFNTVSGDVTGVSGITINNITYNSYDNPNPDIGDYLTLYNFPHHVFKAVTTYNNKSGDVFGVSTIKMNNKSYSYTDINMGVPNLGYYKLLNSYVTSFNNKWGNVYGLYSISISSQNQIYPTNGKINFYHILTTYLYTDYVSTWAKHTDQYFFKNISSNNIITYPSLNEIPNINTDDINRIICFKNITDMLSGNIYKEDPIQISLYNHNSISKTIELLPNREVVHIFYVLDSHNNPISIIEDKSFKNINENPPSADINIKFNKSVTDTIRIYYCTKTKNS